MDPKVLIVLACLMLGGCAMSPIPIGLPCSVLPGGFIPDKGASTRWTKEEKRQLIVLNSTGEALCRWKAP